MTPDLDASAVTLAAYEAYSATYIEKTSSTRSGLVDDLLALVADGASVLELGSGPGRDAAALEAAGLIVSRTDGAIAFVDRFHRMNLDARVLDVHASDFGGPFDAVFANAVLLHVARNDLVGVLSVARRATREGGVLAATVKKGTGEEWSSRKLDAPRHFTYWREPELEAVVVTAGWTPLSVQESTPPGSAERWITLTAKLLGHN